MRIVISIIIILINCCIIRGQLINYEKIAYFSKDSIKSIWKSKHIPKSIAKVKNGVTIYRVSYYTKWIDGTKIKATGSFFLPDNSRQNPLLVYNHGTRIKKGAPKILGGENIMCLIFSSDGYYTISPDYIGLGEGEKSHLYCNVNTEASAGIDFILATKELFNELNLAAYKQLFISGYSQGGHSAMAIHKTIEEEYDDQIKITASCPMSGPYNIAGEQEKIMYKSYNSSSYLPYLIIGLNKAYNIWDEASLYKIFIPPYDTLIPQLFDGKHSLNKINKLLPKVPIDMIIPEIRDQYDNNNAFILKELLKKNDVSNWKPNAPIQMCYCKGDQEVPFQNALVTKKNMDILGAENVKTKCASKRYGHNKCAGVSTIYAKWYFDSFVKGSKNGKKGPIFGRFLILMYKMTHF